MVSFICFYEIIIIKVNLPGTAHRAQINTILSQYKLPPPIINLPGPQASMKQSKMMMMVDKDRFRQVFIQGRIIIHMAPITNLNDVRVIRSTVSTNTLASIANARSMLCLGSSCISDTMHISAQFSNRAATHCVHDRVGLWHFQQPAARVTYNNNGFHWARNEMVGALTWQFSEQPTKTRNCDNERSESRSYTNPKLCNLTVDRE